LPADRRDSSVARRRRLPGTARRIGPSFTCDVELIDDAAVVLPRGELDIATVPELDRALADLRRRGHRALVVDLRELTFIDAAGVRLLLRWAASAARRGEELRLIPGSDRVQLVFRLTGVLHALGLQPARPLAA
jgi:anti-sigma B factor antagonist